MSPMQRMISVLKKHTFDFYAHTDIKAGEEILINYNGDVDDQRAAVV